MYIRRKKTPNSPRQSIQIVEGYRDEKGNVKQRIVRHLGVFADEIEEAKIVALAEDLILKIKTEREASSAQRKLFDLPLLATAPKKGRPTRKSLADIIPVSDVKLEEIIEDRRIIEGVHEIGGIVYDQMNFDHILSKKREAKILKDMTLSRMVAPNSKRGLANYLKEQFCIEHDLDAIYRMMDKLHDQIPRIKELVFDSTLTLIPNKELSLVFFDVTTLYFESTETDDLRSFGYSKDHRFNTTQLVLALATNEDGLPLGYELFAGNTAEVKTLLAALKAWEKFIKVRDVCFVADRAMFSKANLADLEASGYRYIVAAKLKTLKDEVQEEILDGKNYSPTVMGDEFAWVAEFEHEGRRLITSYKSRRAMNDAKERKNILGKIEKVIGKEGSTKKLISNSGIKKYTTTNDSSTYLDQNKIELDAAWDGIHGVITNDKKISAREAIGKYSRLWVIEQAFRINKHNLQMRPIFHWTARRIESHIVMCYMSFAILKQIEYKVALTQKISINNIIESLIGVQASILKHTKTGDLYRLPGSMKNEARKIYKTFGLKRSEKPEIYLQ